MKRIFLVLAVLILFGASGWCEEPMDYDKLESQVWETIERGGDSRAQFHQVMGRTYADSGEQDRAVEHYKKAVELDPTAHMAWYYLGLVDIDNEKGLECLKKAIEVKPDYAPPHYWVAYNYARNGDDENAIKYFEGYLKVASGANEEGRISTATRALEELRSGVEGEELKKIRMRE